MGQWKFECIVAWPLASRARQWRVFLFFPTPCRLRRPNRPKLFLLGLALNSFHGLLLGGRAGQAEQGRARAQQGREGRQDKLEGRAGAEPGGGRPTGSMDHGFSQTPL